MGARNVALAYMLYAGKVPSQSMQLLTYMCLISKDDDERPWYGQGHAALAEHAFGYAPPVTDGQARVVRKWVSPLVTAEAVTVDRRAAPRREAGRTIRYRLNLHPTPEQGVPENTGTHGTQHRNAPRQTPERGVPPEERRGEKRSEVEEETQDSAEALPRAPAREASITEQHDDEAERARATLAALGGSADAYMHKARGALGDDATTRAILIEAARLANTKPRRRGRVLTATRYQEGPDMGTRERKTPTPTPAGGRHVPKYLRRRGCTCTDLGVGAAGTLLHNARCPLAEPGRVKHTEGTAP